jgi:hypothetical protein
MSGTNRLKAVEMSWKVCLALVGHQPLQLTIAKGKEIRTENPHSTL